MFKIERLSGDNFRDIHSPCGHCVYWQIIVHFEKWFNKAIRDFDKKNDRDEFPLIRFEL